MGTGTVPFLLERTEKQRDPPSELKAKVALLLRKFNMEEQAIRYYDTYGQERYATSMWAWRTLRPHAAEVIPVLVDIFNRHPDRAHTVVTAMAYLGATEAAPFLIHQLEAHTNTWHRAHAAWALGQIHFDPSNLPALLQALEDPEGSARTNAAESIKWLAPQASQSVQALIHALNGTNVFLRTAVADALGRLGPVARSAVPALERLSEEATQGLQTSPDSISYKNAKESAEAALDAITDRNLIFSSRWVTPENPFGARPTAPATQTNVTK
jgi:HEAT repeat protein